MGFVMKWLDEDARRKSGLNVNSLVVDEDRDISFWGAGKHWQLRAEGDSSESFVLRIGGDVLHVDLMPALDFWEQGGKDCPIYVWDKVVSILPKDMCGHSSGVVLSLLREILSVYGGGWYANLDKPAFKVNFNF